MEELPQRSVAGAVGQSLRRLRQEAHVTQDEVAHAMNRWGHAWTRSSVAALENGNRDLSAGELLVLPTVISWATGRGVNLRDLLVGDGTYILMVSDRIGMSPWAITDLLDPTVDAQGGDWMKADADEGVPREAEQKAARKLNVSLGWVLSESERIWGRTLTEERDTRVRDRVDDNTSPRSLQAMRGHVTRELTAELDDVLKERAENLKRAKARREGKGAS